jgi:hypothetical protein
VGGIDESRGRGNVGSICHRKRELVAYVSLTKRQCRLKFLDLLAEFVNHLDCGRPATLVNTQHQTSESLDFSFTCLNKIGVVFDAFQRHLAEPFCKGFRVVVCLKCPPFDNKFNQNTTHLPDIMGRLELTVPNAIYKLGGIVTRSAPTQDSRGLQLRRKVGNFPNVIRT